MPTGLYAPPGEAVRVTVPAVLVGKEFAIRIGVHSDTLWHLDSWRRFPEISMQRSLTTPVLIINNPFGGLIYLVVPENHKLDRATITIRISGVEDGAGNIIVPKVTTFSTAPSRPKRVARTYIRNLWQLARAANTRR